MAWARREAERAADRRRSRPDVLQALSARRLGLEPAAVVPDRDQPPPAALRDRDLRTPRLGVPAHVREPLLDDSEQLDLLVGTQRDGVVDLHVDVERAVG